MDPDNEFVKRFVMSLAKANVAAIKDLIDKNESVLDRYKDNLPSSFWIKMIMRTVGVKLDEIDVENVLLELEKHNPNIYQTIYYHTNGLLWLTGQIKMFKEYVDGKKKIR